MGHPSISNIGLVLGYNIVGAPCPIDPVLPESTRSSPSPEPIAVPTIPHASILIAPAAVSPAPALSALAIDLIVLVDPVVAPICFPAATPQISPPLSLSSNDISVQEMAGGKAYSLGHEMWCQYVSSHVPLSVSSTDTESLLQRYTIHFHQLLELYNVPVNPLPISAAMIEDEPSSWSAALRSPNKSFWLHAVFDEICQIVRMHTFDPVTDADIPKNHTPLPAKWVWKTKRDIYNMIEKFKAR